MISLEVLPSVRLRSAKSRVRWQCLRRTITIRQSASLACRLPPVFTRCRVILPNDACTGAAPQRATKAAGACMRSGLSPAATSSGRRAARNWLVQRAQSCTQLVSSSGSRRRRSSSGAFTIRLWIWLEDWVRAFIAERRATLRGGLIRRHHRCSWAQQRPRR